MDPTVTYNPLLHQRGDKWCKITVASEKNSSVYNAPKRMCQHVDSDMNIYPLLNDASTRMNSFAEENMIAWQRFYRFKRSCSGSTRLS